MKNTSFLVNSLMATILGVVFGIWLVVNFEGDWFNMVIASALFASAYVLGSVVQLNSEKNISEE